MEPPVMALAAYLSILLIGICRGQGETNYISNSAVKKNEDMGQPEVDELNELDIDGLTSPGPTVEEEACPPEKPLRCQNGRCFSKRQQCNRKDNCGDNSDELNCKFGLQWPWYHWVLASAFGGAACILAVYGTYLVIDRRRNMNQQDQFRIDRESLDGGGTPVRFVNRDAQNTKYNSINQDTDGLR